MGPFRKNLHVLGDPEERSAGGGPPRYPTWLKGKDGPVIASLATNWAGEGDNDMYSSKIHFLEERRAERDYLQNSRGIVKETSRTN